MTPTTRSSTSSPGRGKAKDPGSAHQKTVKRDPVTTSTSANTKSQEPSLGAAHNGGKKTGAAAPKVSRKRAKARLQKALERRVDAQDEEEMIREQARLLRRASVILAGEGLALPVVLDAATSADMLPQAPNTPALPLGNLEHQYENETEFVDAVELLDVDPTDALKRTERWIPAIGFRRRVGRKPAGVPFGIWAAYKNLDDYVYIQSLSDEDVAALPMEDDIWNFYSSNGGEAPSLPHGFAWDEKRRLVDHRPLEE